MHYRKAANEFLALPLIALSAALCVIEGLTPLKAVDFSVFFAALFAAVSYKRKVLWWAAAALTVYCLYAAADWLTPTLAVFCGSHPAVFGAVNQGYTLLFGSRLSEMVLHTDCTGAVITENGIVTGAADMVAAGTAGAFAAASRWLSGAYFATLFLPLGGVTFLWRRTDRKEKALLVSAILLSALTGDSRLFGLTLLLFSSLTYVVYLLMTALSYFTASLLQCGIGYDGGASVAELLKNGSGQAVLLFLTGCVLAVLYYFVLRYATVKWRKSDEPA